MITISNKRVFELVASLNLGNILVLSKPDA